MNLKFKTHTFTLYIKLFIYILISGTLLYFSNDVRHDILSMIILAVGAMSIVRFEITHPYMWYSVVYLLFSISYPILYIKDLTYDIYEYTQSLIITQWTALTVFLLIVGPVKIQYQLLKNKLRENQIPSKKILNITTLFLLITILNLAKGDFVRKSDMYGNQSFIIFFGLRIALVYLIIYAVNLTTYGLQKNKINWKMVSIVGLVTFLLTYYSGERDLILRFVILSIYIYHVIINKSKLNFKIIILGLSAIFLIPLLGVFKYYGVTGEVLINENMSFIDSFIASFGSASKNLQILLLDGNSNGIFKGLTFASALLRAIGLNSLFDDHLISANEWYNFNYFSERRAGQGFTIVGDGYINYGYLGIIFLFIMIGLIARFLYRKSNQDIYYFVYYVLSIPVFMYSIRADFANILSPLIKQNLLSIILLQVVLKIAYSASKD